jgi:hypothetical protein
MKCSGCGIDFEETLYEIVDSHIKDLCVDCVVYELEARGEIKISYQPEED